MTRQLLPEANAVTAISMAMFTLMNMGTGRNMGTKELSAFSGTAMP